MTNLPTEEQRARTRFIALNAMRVGGVVMVLVGLAVSQGKFDLPRWAAYLLIGLGMIEAFAMPLVFARIWRSEKDRDQGGMGGR
jgi:heme A synthase